MDKEIYFNNDNIPSGEEDPGQELPSRKYNDIQKDRDEIKEKHELWMLYPEIKNYNN